MLEKKDVEYEISEIIEMPKIPTKPKFKNLIFKILFNNNP